MTEPIVERNVRLAYERPQPVLRLVVSNEAPKPRREYYVPRPPRSSRFPLSEMLSATITAIIIVALTFAFLLA